MINSDVLANFEEKFLKLMQLVKVQTSANLLTMLHAS